MRALVYLGPDQIEIVERPKPELQNQTDAIVKISKSSICGSDLRLIKGGYPEVEAGRIPGHEAVGVVESVGSGVLRFRPGSKVIISCITACGTCEFCQREMFSNCVQGGWKLGREIDGVHAEYVRIPHADFSLHARKEQVDEESLVLLSDLFPNTFELGVVKGQVKPGDTVAILGAGTLGLSALLAAQLQSPKTVVLLDLNEERLALARKWGATQTWNNSDPMVASLVMEFFGGEGVDVVIDTVGRPQTFELAQKIVASGGRITLAGIHGVPIDLQLAPSWNRHVTVSTGLVDTHSIPLLSNYVEAGRLDPGKLITHQFPLSEATKAYQIFGNSFAENALKIIIDNRK